MTEAKATTDRLAEYRRQTEKLRRAIEEGRRLGIYPLPRKGPKS